MIAGSAEVVPTSKSASEKTMEYVCIIVVVCCTNLQIMQKRVR